MCGKVTISLLFYLTWGLGVGLWVLVTAIFDLIPHVVVCVAFTYLDFTFNCLGRH
jgi:hypothetical protein